MQNIYYAEKSVYILYNLTIFVIFITKIYKVFCRDMLVTAARRAMVQHCNLAGISKYLSVTKLKFQIPAR